MGLPRIGVKRALRRLRSRVRPGIAILGYHRVSEAGPDPLGLSVTPRHFAAHLDVVKRLGQPMRLAEAAAAIGAGGIPRGAIVLTFDDGYSDNLHAAVPLLERYGVPATIFATSGNWGGEFWWDRLARLNTDCEKSPDAGELAVNLERLPARERDARLLALEMERGFDSRPRHRTLTAEELQTLAQCPLIEIGAHTVSHERLPALPLARQREETRRSREQLELLVNRPVASFAYPHGAFTPETIGIVREAGFTTACCSTYDVAASSAPPLALPRLWVGDFDAERFERWLRGWWHAA